jgi:hypothetical protein
VPGGASGALVATATLAHPGWWSGFTSGGVVGDALTAD